MSVLYHKKMDLASEFMDRFIDWAKENLEPQDIFTEDQLLDWVTNNRVKVYNFLGAEEFE